jgi:hypothetical protein
MAWLAATDSANPGAEQGAKSSTKLVSVLPMELFDRMAKNKRPGRVGVLQSIENKVEII